ncbi:MAG: flagellar basal body P-ring formation chaperone FlgA [Pseudomonadota bacterium]
MSVSRVLLMATACVAGGPFAAAQTTIASSVASASSVSASHSHGDIIATMRAAALRAAEQGGFHGIEVRVRPMDQRLKPARCGQPLETVRPHSGRALGPVSYGVRCAGPVPWTIYLRADVSATMLLPTLTRGLPRGALLGARDLALVNHRITHRAADVITDKHRLIGMELKRPLAAGSLLRHGQVGLPELVTRGQVVTLIAGGPGVEVRMQGKALSSGAAGDRLMIANASSGRRVEGVVLNDGSVQIP